ncbi:MAG: hypothetical protein ACI4JA_03925 [Oscillospiraceae bacterium]
MKNYIREIFWDTLLSIVTKKYGTSLNDQQKEDKADEIIEQLRAENNFTIEMTQATLDKKGMNNFYTTNINGVPVYAIVKEGMFHKIKTCYFITRNKDEITSKYLDQVYEELRKQAMGENIFKSHDYKN